MYLVDGFVVSEATDTAITTAHMIKTRTCSISSNIHAIELTESRLLKTIRISLKTVWIMQIDIISGLVSVFEWATIVGSIQSSAGAVGSDAHLMTKFCHTCV